MRTQTFVDFQLNMKEKVEGALHTRISTLDAPEQLKNSMSYSLQAGGKRIRPLLLFATLQAFGKPMTSAMPLAEAIEMLHTYSLIHDDLPSMDDDDLRRGKPTNHIVFGEATAILAGDALLTLSFECITSLIGRGVDADKVVRLIQLFAKFTGAEGMIKGQALDMEAEQKKAGLAQLQTIHHNKTGKLLAFPIIAGAILSDATQQQQEKMERFAFLLGLCFQIQDDLLDVIGNTEELGKNVGSDEINEKSTYTTLFSIQEVKEILTEKVNEAIVLLDELKLDDVHLRELCYLIVERNH
ncbi:MAG: polyprenyl synthetase family protein [Bacilli bacterium]